jgi:hypothetical protein
MGLLRPHRDIDQRHRYGGHPKPVAFRPRRFSRPRRFHPPLASWVYFTPQPRPGFTRKRSSLSHSRAASSTSRALSSLTRTRCRQLPADATCSNPALRALFRARVRCYKRWGLATARARSLPSFILLQVLPLPSLRTPSRPLPLMTFTKSPSSRPLR